MFFLPPFASPHPVPYVFDLLTFGILHKATLICYYINSRSELLSYWLYFFFFPFMSGQKAIEHITDDMQSTKVSILKEK